MQIKSKESVWLRLLRFSIICVATVMTLLMLMFFVLLAVLVMFFVPLGAFLLLSILAWPILSCALFRFLTHFLLLGNTCATATLHSLVV